MKKWKYTVSDCVSCHTFQGRLLFPDHGEYNLRMFNISLSIIFNNLFLEIKSWFISLFITVLAHHYILTRSSHQWRVNSYHNIKNHTQELVLQMQFCSLYSSFFIGSLSTQSERVTLRIPTPGKIIFWISSIHACFLSDKASHTNSDNCCK